VFPGLCLISPRAKADGADLRSRQGCSPSRHDGPALRPAARGVARAEQRRRL